MRSPESAVDFDAWPEPLRPLSPENGRVEGGPTEWLPDESRPPLQELPITLAPVLPGADTLAPDEAPDEWPCSGPDGIDSDVPETLAPAEAGRAAEHSVEAGCDTGPAVSLAPQPVWAELPDVSATIEPPKEALTVESLPTPRVWFTMPAQLRVDGYEQPLEGAVLNLSQGGVALTTKGELTPGQRVWARFRLGFLDEPNDYLCVVAWRRSDQSGNVIYGCEFSSLSEQERAALLSVVASRSNGIVTEWTVPSVGSDETVPTRRARGTHVTWLVGIVVGVLVAGFVTPKLTGFLGGSAEEIRDTAGEKSEGKPPPIRVASEDETAEADSIATAPKSAPPAERTEGTIELSTVVKPEETDLPSLGTSSTSVPDSFTPSAVRDTSAGEVHLAPTEDGVDVRLELDRAPEGHSTFWLENPRRFVVDVRDSKSRFAANRYDLAHPLIHRLRVGQHPEKVRFVLDVAMDVQTAGEPVIQDQALIVRLRGQN